MNFLGGKGLRAAARALPPSPGGGGEEPRSPRRPRVGRCGAASARVAMATGRAEGRGTRPWGRAETCEGEGTRGEGIGGEGTWRRGEASVGRRTPGLAFLSGAEGLPAGRRDAPGAGVTGKASLPQLAAPGEAVSSESFLAGARLSSAGCRVRAASHQRSDGSSGYRRPPRGNRLPGG